MFYNFIKLIILIISKFLRKLDYKGLDKFSQILLEKINE